mgnify:CR=1 FL=1|jgi:hypothetical protein
MWVRIAMTLAGISCLWLAIPAEAQLDPAPATVVVVQAQR